MALSRRPVVARALGDDASGMNDPEPDWSAREALVNDAMAAYVTWREASLLVREAYGRWHAAGRDERRFAFAGYRRALEGEEYVAARYARVLASADELATDAAWAA